MKRDSKNRKSPKRFVRLSPGYRFPIFSGRSGRHFRGHSRTSPAGFPGRRAGTYGPQGYFAASNDERLLQFCKAVHDKHIDGVIATRRWLRSQLPYRLSSCHASPGPKCMVGFSDFNIIQLLMGECVAGPAFTGRGRCGLQSWRGSARGLRPRLFPASCQRTKSKWKIPLHASRWPKVPRPGVLLADA